MITAALDLIQLRPALALEPPYDDEYSPMSHIAVYPAAKPHLSGQPLLPCFTVKTTPELTPISTRLTPRVRLENENISFDRRNTPRHELPDPGPHTHRLVQALIEMISGARPLGQLVPWLHESLYFELAKRYGGTRRAQCGTASRRRTPRHATHSSASRARVASVRTCEPDDGVTEASAVVHERDRSYAVALRLEGLDGAWRCTSFTVV